MNNIETAAHFSRFWCMIYLSCFENIYNLRCMHASSILSDKREVIDVFHQKRHNSKYNE